MKKNDPTAPTESSANKMTRKKTPPNNNKKTRKITPEEREAMEERRRKAAENHSKRMEKARELVQYNSLLSAIKKGSPGIKMPKDYKNPKKKKQ